MKVSKKIYGLIEGVAIVVLMSIVMSFFMMWINNGFFPGFMFAWLKSIGIGILIGLPAGVVGIPLIQKAIPKYFKVK
jgi:hypothetical protein